MNAFVARDCRVAPNGYKVIKLKKGEKVEGGLAKFVIEHGLAITEAEQPETEPEPEPEPEPEAEQEPIQPDEKKKPEPEITKPSKPKTKKGKK